MHLRVKLQEELAEKNTDRKMGSKVQRRGLGLDTRRKARDHYERRSRSADRPIMNPLCMKTLQLGEDHCPHQL